MVGCTPPLLVVVSDLHIAAGKLDQFDAALELAFVAFLIELGERQRAIELVINGDFLDFVLAAPWHGPELRSISENGVALCFSEAQSRTKLSNITDAHPNVFAALARFLEANNENRVVLLPGNHDADLFWPAVRQAILVKVQEGAGSPVTGRMEFILSRVYRPLAAPELWIEHGHQYDDCNKFYLESRERWDEGDLRPVLLDKKGEPRLIECIGTRFLLQYLNNISASYPFVSNIKPFSKLLKLFFTGSVLFKTGTPVTAVVAAWGMVTYLKKTLDRSPNELLSMERDVELHAASAVSLAFMNLEPDRKREIAAKLSESDIALDVPLEFALRKEEFARQILDVLSYRFDILELFAEPTPELLGGGFGQNGTLSLAQGFLSDETEALKTASRYLLQYCNAKAVVMGHTHEPQDHPDGLNYVNTGSWTRYLNIPIDGATPTSWSLLPTSVNHFPYKLLFAQVDPTQGTEIELICWRQHQ
jgi:UDP-2,3-diacylglucosamine pyrophosphatase LpxH